MGLKKYESSIKSIPWSQNSVYTVLSNFEVLNFFFSEENIEKMKSKMGEEASKFKMENFTADSDTCEFTVSPVGTIGLQIVERDSPKLIKIISVKGPVNFTLWIQLLSKSENECKMKLSLHAELNMMMQMMVGNKLDGGIDKFAEGIAQIPFGNIPLSS